VRLSIDFRFAFNFSASSRSVGHQLTWATLDLGEGGPAVTVPYNPGPSWYYVAPYTTPGTRTVTLRVTDTSGQTSEAASVVVVIVDRPSFTVVPGQPQAGETGDDRA
jgi:hypothetical protein